MSKRKITFEVIVADGFTFPEDDGVTNMHLWPVPTGKQAHINIDLEFEQVKDAMKDAETALDIYIKKNYPRKEYKIYYWWWID
jgi:hypothetical protein